MENKQEMCALLERLEKANRQQAAYARIQCIFSILTAVCCIVLLIMAVRFVPQIQELSSRADAVLTNLETVADELSELDLSAMVENVDSLVSNVDSLVTTSQEGVEEAMQKIDSINLEALNQAIEDLSAVIQPLAKFVNMFN